MLVDGGGLEGAAPSKPPRKTTEEAGLMAAITLPARRAARRSRVLKENLKRLGVTSLTLAVLALFLSPFLHMVYMALSTTDQMTALGAPAWPARPATFSYQGQELEVY